MSFVSVAAPGPSNCAPVTAARRARSSCPAPTARSTTPSRAAASTAATPTPRRADSSGCGTAAVPQRSAGVFPSSAGHRSPSPPPDTPTTARRPSPPPGRRPPPPSWPPVARARAQSLEGGHRHLRVVRTPGLRAALGVRAGVATVCGRSFPAGRDAALNSHVLPASVRSRSASGGILRSVHVHVVFDPAPGGGGRA